MKGGLRLSTLLYGVTLLMSILSVSSGLITDLDRKTEHICYSIDVRNSIQNFEKLRNCTTVLGNVAINLLQNPFTNPSEEMNQLSFPNLREITGFLSFYRVDNLLTAETLFPNLELIRGLTTISNRSLAIANMDHMTHIGLPSLKMIQNGNVIMGYSPNVCYVNTIDWGAIMTNPSLNHYQNVVRECSLFESCNGCEREKCWSETSCQQFIDTEALSKCDSSCLIGCTGPTASDCYYCKGYSYNRTCVYECPAGTYMDPETYRCLSQDECLAMQKIPFMDYRCLSKCPNGYSQFDEDDNYHQLKCFKCGEVCTKFCFGIEIRNPEEAEMYDGCTHVQGNLIIELSKVNADTMRYLGEYLNDIKYITGVLKIIKSPSLENLHFLSRLEYVGHGKRSLLKRAILIHDNPDLTELFDYNQVKSLRVNGTVDIFYNPRLCRNVVKKFDDIIKYEKGVEVRDRTDPHHFINQKTNGFTNPCDNSRFLTEAVSQTQDSTQVNWIYESDDSGKYNVLSFVIFYRKANTTKLTTTQIMEACDGGLYTERLNIDQTTQYNKPSTHTVVLTNLSDFQLYVYFVEVELIKLSTKELFYAYSQVNHFTTSPKKPESPIFNVLNKTSTSITIMYRSSTVRPQYIKSYYLFVTEMPSYVADKDYCEPGIQIIDSDAPDNSLYAKSQYAIEWEKTRIHYLKEYCPRCQPALHLLYSHAGMKRNYTDEEVLREFMFYCTKENYDDVCPTDHWINYEIEELTKLEGNNTVNRVIFPSKYTQVILLKNESDIHTITDLNPFVTYKLTLYAGNALGYSKPFSQYEATFPDPEADAVRDLTITEYTFSPFRFFVEFKPPVLPSGGTILRYDFSFIKMHSERIANKSLEEEIEHYQWIKYHHDVHFECVLPEELGTDSFYLSVNQYPAGRYAARMRVYTIAGPGKYSPAIEVELKGGFMVVPWVFISITLLIIVALIGIIYCVRKRWETRFKRMDERSIPLVNLAEDINYDWRGTEPPYAPLTAEHMPPNYEYLIDTEDTNRPRPSWFERFLEIFTKYCYCYPRTNIFCRPCYKGIISYYFCKYFINKFDYERQMDLPDDELARYRTNEIERKTSRYYYCDYQMHGYHGLTAEEQEALDLKLPDEKLKDTRSLEEFFSVLQAQIIKDLAEAEDPVTEELPKQLPEQAPEQLQEHEDEAVSFNPPGPSGIDRESAV